MPSLLPFGYKIGRIASVDNEVDYVKNSRNKKPLRLKKLIIDDSINLIMEEAFYFANIKEVHWPKSCITIPFRCFGGSKIESISGVEDVVFIEDQAFAGSDIKSFAWPSRCKRISAGCFTRSSLEAITGVENVNEVASGAFAGSCIKNLSFPQPYCNIEASAFYDCDPATITLPFFISAEDYECAFSKEDRIDFDLSDE